MKLGKIVSLILLSSSLLACTQEKFDQSKLVDDGGTCPTHNPYDVNFRSCRLAEPTKLYIEKFQEFEFRREGWGPVQLGSVTGYHLRIGLNHSARKLQIRAQQSTGAQTEIICERELGSAEYHRLEDNLLKVYFGPQQETFVADIGNSILFARSAFGSHQWYFEFSETHDGGNVIKNSVDLIEQLDAYARTDCRVGGTI